MQTKDLTNLKINTLTQAQYDAAKAAGTLSEEELYLTPSTESSSADWANITNKPQIISNLGDTGFLRWPRTDGSAGSMIGPTTDDNESVAIKTRQDIIINASGKTKIYNLTTPTNDNDAANKKYVDDKVAAIPTGPTITYGTTDLVAGTSELAEGTFYFVYE